MNGEMAGRGSRSERRNRYSTMVDRANPVHAEVSPWCFTVSPMAGIISVLGVTEILGWNAMSRASKASGFAERRKGSSGGSLRGLRGRGVLRAEAFAAGFFWAARPACFLAAMAASLVVGLVLRSVLTARPHGGAAPRGRSRDV
ncbi:hypothetical protein D9M69_573840 [compost metagenome]